MASYWMGTGVISQRESGRIVQITAHHHLVPMLRMMELYLYFRYTGCNRRNGPDFGRVFLMLNYTEKTPKHLYPKLNGLGDNCN